MVRGAVPLLALALVAGAATLARPAAAVERIVEFHADVEVHADGHLTVQERITVVAEGVRIKRGIYRDVPTRYRTRLGLTRIVPFVVRAAERDGTPEPWRAEPRSNGVRVYLGRADVLLRPGTYTYTLTYVTDRQLGFFPQHDELYWNVTGTGWEFPIDRARATVTLPPEVPTSETRLQAYTGAQGARGQAFRARLSGRGQAEFETTAPLPARHGLTIVVAWPKGFVTEPTAVARLGWLAADNHGALAGAAGLVLLLLYYGWAWTRVGRDPPGGVVVPRFAPPRNLSPAAVRYIARMGFDETAFAATVVGLAVQGFLRIVRDDDTYTLRRTTGTDGSRLTKSERAVLDALFAGHPEITLASANHARVRGAIDALRTRLAQEYHGVHFVTNRRWLVPGLALAAVTLAATGLTGADEPVAFLVISLWLTGWSFAVFFLWAQRQYVIAAFFSLFEVLGLTMLVLVASAPTAALLLLLVLVTVVFYHLLRAPTRSGRAIMDEIEGFRHYLAVAEAPRLEILNPPEETPALFERFLPYALALGVEQQWSERFARILAASATGPVYSPAWFHGASGTRLQPAGLASALGGSLTSAIAAASTAPGSSSGGGGGGSSGGGGGGGGGGGW